MFAARTHNENAIYEQQTAAAAKPQNQGVKGLAPKTPGNKAPKALLNDENVAFGKGKTGIKGREGGLFGGGKVDRSAFVTPAGPRTRAPLGNKTTNAKANVQTPATAKPSATKPTSPRLRRGKVKIHIAESDPLDNAEPEEREIEYMPPREVPLPDYPDDWPHDRSYPQFEGQNFTRGWWAEFGGVKDAPASDEEGSDFEEKYRKAEEGKMAREAAAEARLAAEKRPLTLKSKSAASALSTTEAQKQRATPGFAAPTAAARARLASVPRAKEAVASTGMGNARHTAAKVASNTTLGYSKGRVVSGRTRQPLSAVYEKRAATEPEAKKAHMKPRNIILHDLLGIQDLGAAGSEDELDPLGGAASLDMLSDELEDFQLQPLEP
ncbi:hypothetical protein LTR53_006671 [Teratosphaeriaceae sp. CCFEE 6253]|nr:hypothetical protein LTR53_006671 [Teratosphaeriaceae sp. CCFEE 6253]